MASASKAPASSNAPQLDTVDSEEALRSSLGFRL